jgi:predicted ester cyclase
MWGLLVFIRQRLELRGHFPQSTFECGHLVVHPGDVAARRQVEQPPDSSAGLVHPPL